MNIVDLIINFYGLLIGGGRWLSPMRYLVRKVADFFIPLSLKHERNQINQQNHPSIADNRKLIVSFTSFPARMDRVWLVVRCLKRQSIKPDKIVLWLSREQFQGVKLPDSLTTLLDDTFEIRMVEHDYRSHKKYCYAFSEFQNDIVILVDDDIYYDSKMIEKLLVGLYNHPDSVICQYGSLIKYNMDGTLPPFNQWWKEERKAIESKDFFLGTGGGSLFIPSKLEPMILDTNLALSLTPLADDIWVNAMIRLSGLSIYKIKCGLLLQISESQSSALKHQNSYEGQNDVQFKNVIDFFTAQIGINPFNKREKQ